MNGYNPWPVGSEWWYIVEEMNAKARARRALNATLHAQCPICEGRGTVGVVFGTKDDENHG